MAAVAHRGLRGARQLPLHPRGTGAPPRGREHPRDREHPRSNKSGNIPGASAGTGITLTARGSGAAPGAGDTPGAGSAPGIREQFGGSGAPPVPAAVRDDTDSGAFRLVPQSYRQGLGIQRQSNSVPK